MSGLQPQVPPSSGNLNLSARMRVTAASRHSRSATATDRSAREQQSQLEDRAAQRLAEKRRREEEYRKDEAEREARRRERQLRAEQRDKERRKEARKREREAAERKDMQERRAGEREREANRVKKAAEEATEAAKEVTDGNISAIQAELAKLEAEKAQFEYEMRCVDAEARGEPKPEPPKVVVSKPVVVAGKRTEESKERKKEEPTKTSTTSTVVEESTNVSDKATVEVEERTKAQSSRLETKDDGALSSLNSSTYSDRSSPKLSTRRAELVSSSPLASRSGSRKGSRGDAPLQNHPSVERLQRKLDKLHLQLEEEREERLRLDQKLQATRTEKRREVQALKVQLTDMQDVLSRDATVKKRLQRQVEQLSTINKSALPQMSPTAATIKELRNTQRLLAEAQNELEQQRERVEEVEKELRQVRSTTVRQSVRGSRRADQEISNTMFMMLRQSSARARRPTADPPQLLLSRDNSGVSLDKMLSPRGTAPTQAEFEALNAQFAEMQARLQREQATFEAEMAKIEAAANARAMERDAAEHARKERREREQHMLKALQLDAEKAHERKVERLQAQLSEAKKALVALQAQREAETDEYHRKELGLRREYEAKLGARDRVIRDRGAQNVALSDKNARLEALLQRVRKHESSITDEMQLEHDEFKRALRLAEQRAARHKEELEDVRQALGAAEGDATRNYTDLAHVMAELADTRDELDAVRAHLEERLVLRGQELREEREIRWQVEADLDAANDELKKLRFYFLPSTQQEQRRANKTAPKTREQVPQQSFAERMKRERLEELSAVRKLVSCEDDMRKFDVASAQKALCDALERLIPSQKEKHAAALGALLEAMEACSYSGKTKMVICLALTHFRVPIQLIMELIDVAEHYVEKGQLAALDTPEGVIARLLGDYYRKLNRGMTSVSFKDNLLEELVRLRARRTGKSVEESRMLITEALAELDDE